MNLYKNKMIDLINKYNNVEIAFSVHNRDKNKNWYCPLCKSKVIITGKKRYETMFEHISNPNKVEYPLRDIYQCSNSKCFSIKEKIFWDYEGNRYNGNLYFDKECINNNDAPFGSFQRKQNVEIQKKGVKDITRLHPSLCLWFLQPFIEHNYIANTDGNVLKRKNSLKFLKKDEQNEYSILFTTCFTTWHFLFKRFFNNFQKYKKTKKVSFLKEAFRKYYNNSWEYKIFDYFIKIFYSKYIKKIKHV